MANVNQETSEVLFHLRGPDGQQWELRKDGSFSGFPAGTVLVNRAQPEAGRDSGRRIPSPDDLALRIRDLRPAIRERVAGRLIAGNDSLTYAAVDDLLEFMDLTALAHAHHACRMWQR
ncbi:hypothetical protein [Delftia acidovorans]